MSFTRVCTRLLVAMLTMSVRLQAILAPARMLYHLLGKNVYLQLYAFIDNHIDIAEAGTAYGGHMAIAASVTSLALAGLIAPKLAKHT